MSALVRAGLVAAKRIAAGVVSISARMAVRSEPTSSRTTASSSAWDSHAGSGSGGGGSEAPVPRRSNRISRENDPSERRNRATPRVLPGDVDGDGAGHD